MPHIPGMVGGVLHVQFREKGDCDGEYSTADFSAEDLNISADPFAPFTAMYASNGSKAGTGTKYVPLEVVDRHMARIPGLDTTVELRG